MKIAIYGKKYALDFKEYIQQLFDRLHAEKVELSIYRPFYEFIINETGCKAFECSFFNSPAESPDDVDFLISIGGDGTFLESMLYLKSSSIPVIGLNSGRMGFLANIGKEEISKALDAIF
jgi:NAD+ kinase